MNTLVLWNDEVAGRMIKYVVDYSISDDMLHILEVTAIEVSIVNKSTQFIESKTAVMSSHGLTVLKKRFIDSGMLPDLVERIATKHNLTVIS